jgi:predicted kinase
MGDLVFVSGAPGSGKTTLARPLATELGLPLFGKDRIKEVLHDALSEAAAGPALASSPLGAAAMELLWALAADAPACVLEANFWPGMARVREQLLALSNPGALVEVYCACPPEEARRRYDRRAASQERHRVHGPYTADPRAVYSGPLALGAVVEVDTTGSVDVPEVADRVRRAFADATARQLCDRQVGG